MTQLLEVRFTGVINVGSPQPCSKFDFGMQLAERFEFNQSLIKKGSIVDYNFKAPRFNNLTLNTQSLSNLGIIASDYRKSIKKFKQNKPGL